jgi:lysozyme
MTLSHQGEQLIKHFEHCILAAYKDSKGVWTIGWGNTFYENGKPVRQGDTTTQVRADELFKKIVQKFINEVNYLTKKVSLKQHQFDALVSFAYNCGIANLQKSTLLKLVLSDTEAVGIPGEFAKWNQSGGKALSGLARRRKAESHLYATGQLNYFQ